MSDKTKFKVGDSVVIVDDSDGETPRVGDCGKVSEILHESRVFDYRVTFSDGKSHRYGVDELFDADQHRQPADADLTPDERATLHLTGTGIWCASDSEYTSVFKSLERRGYVRALNVCDNGTAYVTTQDGRDYLAKLNTSPADTITAHKPFTDDDMQTWIARMAMGYPRAEVQDQECCPGAADIVHNEVGTLVKEIMRLRKQNKALYEALQPFANAKSVVGFADYTNTSTPYDAFTNAMTAVYNYENE